MTAYYNEWEPYPAQWLRNLITAGLIAPGDVDERSIKDVKADDLKGYTQCHFFAGIGFYGMPAMTKPTIEFWEDPEVVKIRDCLKCTAPFKSMNKGERICDECHRSKAFRHFKGRNYNSREGGGTWRRR